MSLSEFENLFGTPAGKPLSRLIRPMIVAPDGKTLVWGDWSNIEARGLPWLGKAEKRLDIFREIDSNDDAADVYVRAVAGMYGHDLSELWTKVKAKDKWAKGERQKGKIAELALGFSGGYGALQSMAAQYGMSFETTEAKDIVERWRADNIWAEAFWDDLWDAFLSATSNPDGTMFEAGHINYQGMMVGDQVWVVGYLPDGFPLFYRNVRERKHITYDEFEPDVVLATERKLSFESEKGLKWLWRGLLAENVTQAVCARILREALLHLEKVLSGGNTGATIVGHTHDEILLLVDDNAEAVQSASDILYNTMVSDAGCWHEGLPLEVDIETNPWYSKAAED